MLKEGKHISTVELDDAYHRNSSYLIQTEDTNICKDIFKNKDDYNYRILDNENFLINTSVSDGIETIKKLFSEKMKVFAISKQSNLMEFFND